VDASSSTFNEVHGSQYNTSQYTATYNHNKMNITIVLSISEGAATILVVAFFFKVEQWSSS